MKKLSIDEYLNDKNPWTARLKGSASFQKQRDLIQIENEYNLDKYAKLMGLNLSSVEEYKLAEFKQAGLDPFAGEMAISVGDEIFMSTIAEAREGYYKMIKKYLNKYSSPRYCELGCGYGYNLSLISGEVYGGEYSSNAVKIAQKLGVDVVSFNYYNENDYSIIRPESTVFTVHSIEQIPDASVIINSLEKNRDKINYVIHFEPTIVTERENLVGKYRNKYIELNDYNRNLIDVIRSNRNIEILEFIQDEFGIMPLNSSNVIVWKFK